MIKAIFFDINGTLIDILTGENDDAFRVTTNFLRMLGVDLPQDEVKKLYYELNRAQRAASEEKYPEFDAVKIFTDIIEKHCSLEVTHEGCKLPGETVADIFRAAMTYKLELYPGVRQVLDQLKEKFIFAAVTDGQSQWARHEICMTGLDKYFQTVVISGDYGFRKPDPRMYMMALEKLNLTPGEVIFVGNDIFRDIYGAQTAGMKTVLFKSNQGDHKSGSIEADYIIYNFNELPKAVAFIQSRCS